MSNQLPLPEELKLLLEKRETERREREPESLTVERRDGSDRRGTQAIDNKSKYCPGEIPGETGIYRCERCLEVVRVKTADFVLPACQQCGNQEYAWFELLTKC